MKYSKSVILLTFYVCFFEIQDIFCQRNINLSPTDCWNISFVLQKDAKVYLQAEIKNQEGKVLTKLRSQNMSLKSGQITLSQEIVQTAKLDYFDDEAQKYVNRTGSFPKGQYTVCTSVQDISTQSELSLICNEYTVAETILGQQNKSRVKNVDFFGSANLEFNYINPISYYAQLPSSFIRLEAEQGASIYGVPISGQFRYSTEKPGLNQDVNMFRLNFDKNRFDRQIKEIIIRKLAETQLNKVQKYAGDLQKLTEIENIEESIKVVGQQKLDTELKNMENDLRSYANDATEDAKAKYAPLRKKYDKLLQEKKKLDNLKSRYDELMALKKTWIDSGKWEELKNLAFDPPDLSDPKILLNEMKKYGNYTGMNKFLYNFQELSIGTSFPTFSPLTLNGLQINGASVAINPGNVKIATAIGKTHGTSDFNNYLPEGRFAQNLVAARLGFGREYGSSINFSALRYKNMGRNPQTNVPTEDQLPEESWVGGTDFIISIGKLRNVELHGEIAGLYKNQNTNDTIQRELDLSNFIPERKVSTNLSTSVDFAVSSGLVVRLFDQQTVIQGRFQFVGPGYVHPGVFGLRNDILRKEVGVHQKILANKLDFGFQFINEDDNNSQAKIFKTGMNQLSIFTNMLAIKNMSIRLNVSKIDFNNEFYTYQSNLISIGLNKLWKFSIKVQANTNIQTTYYRTLTDSISQNINSSYIALFHSMSISTWSVNITGQFSKNATSIFSGNQKGGSLTFGKQFKNLLSLNLGAQYHSVSNEDYRLGIIADIQAQFFTNLSLSIKAFQNNYSVYPDHVGTRNEQLVQSSIKYQW